MCQVPSPPEKLEMNKNMWNAWNSFHNKLITWAFKDHEFKEVFFGRDGSMVLVRVYFINNSRRVFFKWSAWLAGYGMPGTEKKQCWTPGNSAGHLFGMVETWPFRRRIVTFNDRGSQGHDLESPGMFLFTWTIQNHPKDQRLDPWMVSGEWSRSFLQGCVFGVLMALGHHHFQP